MFPLYPGKEVYFPPHHPEQATKGILSQKFMSSAIAKRGLAGSQEIYWALKTMIHQKQSELSICF